MQAGKGDVGSWKNWVIGVLVVVVLVMVFWKPGIRLNPADNEECKNPPTVNVSAVHEKDLRDHYLCVCKFPSSFGDSNTEEHYLGTFVDTPRASAKAQAEEQCSFWGRKSAIEENLLRELRELGEEKIDLNSMTCTASIIDQSKDDNLCEIALSKLNALKEPSCEKGCFPQYVRRGVELSKLKERCTAKDEFRCTKPKVNKIEESSAFQDDVPEE
ncbi:hypothetical protein FJZ22_02710 [Candidatus Pacearchaeota archaeon]|nr:hypothetical protein [Candidatus Pacearchaeota archaeon]